MLITIIPTTVIPMIMLNHSEKKLEEEIKIQKEKNEKLRKTRKEMIKIINEANELWNKEKQ